MKYILILFLTLSITCYNRNAAVNYAKKHWNNPNHDCNSNYIDCNPYSYWGDEHCGYFFRGGDCANFVSQCLLAGGHPILKGGECSGFPCGKEEVGAGELAICLTKTFGWKSDCGYKMEPPSDVKPGDVLVYHKTSCNDLFAHSVIVVEGGKNVKVASHSTEHYGIPYTYLVNHMPIYQWIRFPN